MGQPLLSMTECAKIISFQTHSKHANMLISTCCIQNLPDLSCKILILLGHFHRSTLRRIELRTQETVDCSPADFQESNLPSMRNEDFRTRLFPRFLVSFSRLPPRRALRGAWPAQGGGRKPRGATL